MPIIKVVNDYMTIESDFDVADGKLVFHELCSFASSVIYVELLREFLAEYEFTSH